MPTELDELDDHLDPDAPGPTDDPEDALDQELREAFLAASMLQMDALTKALRQGRSPVRVLRLIETVASASRVGFSELRADDFDDDELEGDFAMDHVGFGQVAPRRRRRRGNGMNVGVGGMAYGGGGLLHGPPDGPARHLMGQLEQMGDGMSMANRARTLRDLTGAIANAREMQDEELERELRTELDQLRAVPRDPDNVITNAPVLVADNDNVQQPAERDAAQGG